MKFWAAACLFYHILALLSSCEASTQVPLLSRPVDVDSALYDQGLFTPLENLEFVSETSFTTLEHPAFPAHRVRIKKSKFCDGRVNSYTGYIDVGPKHTFFYFFESRSDPEKDDFIFWTNGGAGASSALGLFMELGPCRALTANGSTYHPESWNTNANVFFVDQPVGVGFSYADYDGHVSTTEDAAQDIAAFIALFFQHFTKYQGRPLHMAGESYGGRYLPLFAAAVYDQNAALIEQGMTPVNLTSVMIGNGMTDSYSMFVGYVEMPCTRAEEIGPLQTIQTCVSMRLALPRCQQWTTKACINAFDAVACKAAISFCQTEIEEPFWQLGVNPYDISKTCDRETLQDTLCYSETRYIVNYLNDPKIQKSIGVDKPTNFSSVDWHTNQLFTSTMDEYHPDTPLYVAELLERRVRVLVYVGTYDWICNWIGNEIWTLNLKWSGQSEFASKALREWSIASADGVAPGDAGSGKAAGKVRSAGGLTFATIYGAGHMVPYDKPRESLEMVQRWLANESL